MHLWPWREKSVTGTAPVSITDLGVIEAVTNESQDYRLQQAQFRDLLDAHGDLTTSGSPECYYIGWPSGSPVVATYPSNADTIGVQYWKVTADLSGSSDTPASPTETHYLIVDLAVRRAALNAGDHDGAAAVQQQIDRQVGDLMEQYPPGVGDFQGHIVQPSSDW
jgi:predicted trehalose synthase